MKTHSHRVLKAKLLSIALVGSMLWIGLLVGSWLVPLLVVCLSSDKISLVDFPIQAGVFPLVPSVLDPEVDRFQYALLTRAGIFVGLAGAALFGWLGLRCNHYLVVKKFKWLSEEDVKNINKTQWM